MRYWLDEKRIVRNMKETELQYSQEIKKQSNAQKKHELRQRMDNELSMANDDLDWMKTQRIIYLAKKIDIPIPYEEMEDTYSFERVLRDRSRFRIRKEIRAEKSFRWNLFFAFGALFVGLISAVSSLLH